MTGHGKTRAADAGLFLAIGMFGLCLTVSAAAAPRREAPLNLDGGGLPGDAPAAANTEHSCDGVWEQLSTRVAPWSAEVSLSRAYQLAGVSTLAPVQEDAFGRFSVRASLFHAGEPGVVDIRFGRTGVESRYTVWVTTCDAEGACRETVMESGRVQCATRRDHATLTVREVGPHQKVVVSFSK